MNNEQPKALELADKLELCWGDKRIDDAAAELRRLHSLNAELINSMRYIQEQTHVGHIHDTASAAIAKAKEQA